MRHFPPLFVLAAAASLTLACAQKTTPVYASPGDTEGRVLFTLAPGDACTPLRSVVMKAYLHTEIECSNGRGWVIDKQNFSIGQVQ